MMASFQLEDLTGSIEVLVFPRLFSQSVNLDNDKIVIVNGRYYINEEEKKIFSEKITLIEDSMISEQAAATNEEVREEVKEYETNQSKLYIKIDNIGDQNFITPVYFFLKGESKLFEVSKSYNVLYSSQLELELSSLVGKENIKYTQDTKR